MDQAVGAAEFTQGHRSIERIARERAEDFGLRSSEYAELITMRKLRLVGIFFGLLFAACSPERDWTEFREVFPGHGGEIIVNGTFSRYDDISMSARNCSEDTGFALCMQGPITFALPRQILELNQEWSLGECIFRISQDFGHGLDVGTIYIYSQCQDDLLLYSYDESIGLIGFSLLNSGGYAVYVYRLASSRGFPCRVERDGVRILFSDCSVEHLEE